jgi:hypothetical protein
MKGDNGMKSSPSCAEGTYHMHLGSLLCTYVDLISGSSNGVSFHYRQTLPPILQCHTRGRRVHL